MVLYELLEDEQHPAYRALESANLRRQYGFLTSIINAALAIHRPMVSTGIMPARERRGVSSVSGQNHAEYVETLQSTDAASSAEWEHALNRLRLFVLRLLNEQIASVGS